MNEDIEFENLYKVLVDYASKLSALYKSKISPHRSSGRLEDSVDFRVEIVNGDYIVSLNLEDYYINLEEGRSPGTFPNLSEIKKWISTKPVTWANFLGTNDQQAYLIGRSIERNGIVGHHYLEDSIERLQSELIRDITEALELDLKDNIDLEEVPKLIL